MQPPAMCLLLDITRGGVNCLCFFFRVGRGGTLADLILANFYVCGRIFKFTTLLNNLVIYSIAIDPKCFKCCMEMISEPVEILMFASFSGRKGLGGRYLNVWTV